MGAAESTGHDPAVDEALKERFGADEVIHSDTSECTLVRPDLDTVGVIHIEMPDGNKPQIGVGVRLRHYYGPDVDNDVYLAMPLNEMMAFQTALDQVGKLLLRESCVDVLNERIASGVLDAADRQAAQELLDDLLRGDL